MASTKPKKPAVTTKPKAKAAAPAATEAADTSVAAQTENTSKFILEDNIPIPATVRFGGGAASPYPFASMQVGQSFVVKAETDPDIYANDDEFGKAVIEDLRTIANRMSGACRRFTKKQGNEGFKFRVKTVLNEGGVRVWRVE